MSNPALDKMSADYGDHRSWMPTNGPTDSQVTTLDLVIRRTGMLLGIVVVGALIAWFYTNALLAPTYDSSTQWGSVIENSASTNDNLSMVAGLAFLFSLIGTGLSFYISFSRSIRLWAIMSFAVIEGLVLGFLSAIIGSQVGVEAPIGAVVGTIVSFAVILGLYNLIRDKITDKFMRITSIFVLGIVAVSLVNIPLMFLGASLGIEGYGVMGIGFSLLAYCVACAMLLSDFRMVEDAVKHQLPANESWRLAFGLTVTLIWLYVNLLRLIAAMRR